MYNDLFGVGLILLIVLLSAYPLGKYISRIFKGEPVFTDFLRPLEEKIFDVCGIDARHEMDWKGNAKALLRLNAIFFVWAFILLVVQGETGLLNPANILSMDPFLAFNTAASFVTNTNLQHYSGETGLSYFSQIAVICFLQFVSAASGIAVFAHLLVGLAKRQSNGLGNFYYFFVRSATRILLPLALLVSLLLLIFGTPNNYSAPVAYTNLQGDSAVVAMGPVATITSIKQLGTNGGGFYGTNSAHPFENANYITNVIENISILLIPIALVFTFGFYMKQRKLSFLFFTVMSLLFLMFVAGAIYFEVQGNPVIAKTGVMQDQGSMEGKETRFGSVLSAFWGVSTTSTSNGGVNSMFDSQTPLSGGIYLMDMMINAIYGGVGVGMLNFFLFVIVAAFIGGLMVGRTPEFLGKKIEAKEIKIAVLVILLHPILILSGTALSSYLMVINPANGWLSNGSYHGFSQMLYEFTSAAANNGSGFEGLSDNNAFWNISTGLVMLLSRFIPILGPLAIAGSLASKNIVPSSEGTLDSSSVAFGVILLGVIIVVTALSFFPALSLGPIAEYLSL
jgi:K+-transporting ATPase ATPase A chain